jgi:hypothetical protein
MGQPEADCKKGNGWSKTRRPKADHRKKTEIRKRRFQNNPRDKRKLSAIYQQPVAADVKSAQSNRHHSSFLTKVRSRFFDRPWLMMSRSDINQPASLARALAPNSCSSRELPSHAVSPLGFKSDPSDLKGGPSNFLNTAPQHDAKTASLNTTRRGSGIIHGLCRKWLS